MRTLIPLILVLSGTPVITQFVTKFEFVGELFCSHRPDFLYKINVYEDDWKGDDLISNTSSVDSKGPPHYYVAHAQDNNDGWPKCIPLDSQFEIYLHIMHDCTKFRQHNYFYVDIGKFPIDDGFHRVSKDINVTNAGLWSRVSIPDPTSSNLNEIV